MNRDAPVERKYSHDRRKMNDFERKVVSLPTTFMWSQH